MTRRFDKGLLGTLLAGAFCCGVSAFAMQDTKDTSATTSKKKKKKATDAASTDTKATTAPSADTKPTTAPAAKKNGCQARGWNALGFRYR